MRRFTTAIAGLIVILFPVLGQTIDLQYADGLLEKRTDAGWEEVSIGDRLRPEDSLRVSGDGYAELSAGSQLLTLHKAGVYKLSDLISASEAIASWNMGSVMGSKLAALGGGKQSIETQAAAMGVRGAAQGQTEMGWMEDEGSELMRESLKHMEAEEYQQARELLQEAIDIALDEKEQAEYRFYAAFAEEMMGKRGQALRLLKELQPDTSADYYGDYTLLHGRLLVETSSFDEGLVVLQAYLDAYPEGSIAQTALILSAMAHRGGGDTSRARVQLERARSLDPSSAPGRKASELLSSL